MTQPSLTMQGIEIFQAMLAPQEQEALVADLRSVILAAPLFRPVTARGTSMSVRMTSAGRVGWVSDRAGYRY